MVRVSPKVFAHLSGSCAEDHVFVGLLAGRVVSVGASREVQDGEAAVADLVERFGVEPFSDFSAKRANFIGLVLFCIDAKFCKKIFVGKLLTRSTRFTCFCTAQTSIFQKCFGKLYITENIEV